MSMNTGDRDRRNSAVLRGRAGGAGRGSVNSPVRAGGAQSGFDLGAYVRGELLGMYQNSGGQYVGGTPGYTVSRAGERAAATAARDRAEADRSSNYAEIDRRVQARNPEIRGNYAAGTKDLRDNAAALAVAQRAAIMERERDAARAAAEMGLAVNPGATGRAGETAERLIGRRDTQAENWAGFNTGAAERAVERNNAVGDTFQWQGNMQQQELNQVLASLLAGLQDQYVPGRAGRMVGGLSSSQKLRLLGMLDGQADEDFDQELATARLAQGTDWR